jgi:hypothetical protein
MGNPHHIREKLNEIKVRLASRSSGRPESEDKNEMRLMIRTSYLKKSQNREPDLETERMVCSKFWPIKSGQ